MDAINAPDLSGIFEPFTYGPLRLANRIVMAPMTRSFSPGGVAGPEVAAYYRRRTEGGVGLIITEGTWIDHPGASNDVNVPRFYGQDALEGWRHVVAEVHAAGGKIMPQLWHVGLTRRAMQSEEDAAREDLSAKYGPSGVVVPGGQVAEPMSETQILALIDAYAKAAASAKALGFDGIEIHGAHGYMVDQFFWSATNQRDDDWGGEELAARSRFGVEMIRACRAATGPDFPIVLRFSQWKLADYAARLATTPQELASLLEPLAEAGVDMFHASQRRFWEPEFAGSDLNLAGWARKLTGKPAITVGSVGLEREMVESVLGSAPVSMEKLGVLTEMLARGDFDLVAVGRAVIADADWAEKLHRGAFGEFSPYSVSMLGSLV